MAGLTRPALPGGKRRIAPPHRDLSAAHHLDDAERLEPRDHRVDVRRLARNLQRHRLLAGVHDVRARLVDDAEQRGSVVAGDRDLDEREVARHRRHGAEVLDLQDVDELVEIRGHALGARLIAVDDDRHPRDARLGGVADAERFDVEDTAAEERRHAIEDAWLVFDQHDESVLHSDSSISIGRALLDSPSIAGLTRPWSYAPAGLTRPWSYAPAGLTRPALRCLDWIVGRLVEHRRLGAPDHRVEIGAGGDHRVHAVFLLDAEINHRRALGLARALDDLLEAGTVVDAQAEQAMRLRNLDEVGAAERRRRVPALVEELLPLPHHPEITVVDDRDVDLHAFLRGGAQFRLRHLEAAVADDRPHLRVGFGHLGADRRGEAESHRSEPARRDERAGRVVMVVLRLPH